MQKLLIHIPEGLVRELDAKARENHLNRSEALRESVRFWTRHQASTAPKNLKDIRRILKEMDQARKEGRSRKSAEAMVREDREGARW